VYLLLPYFKSGNLQDIINANLVNHNLYPELDLLRLFEQVVAGLKELHTCEKVIDLIDKPGRQSGRPGRQGKKPTTRTLDTDSNGDVQMPLMGDLESSSNITSLAHCDIKPGKESKSIRSLIYRQHNALR
jgi:serine/threonine kinase 16